MSNNPDPQSLKLVLHPDPALYTKSDPFILENGNFIDKDLPKQYSERLIKVLSSIGGNGIGLAANQIGLLKRVFVCFSDLNHTAKSSSLKTYINPEIIDNFGEEEVQQEGCLSFPNIKGYVSRRPNVTLKYLDCDGKEHIETSNGLQARCWLHEIDHLDGINIVDRFNNKDKKACQIMLKKLKKIRA